MASAIHHGPPGSFKSFTLVQRRAIDALKEGRVVVTNIRGFTSIDRIRDEYGDIDFPDTADLWFINTDDKQYRPFMAGWFHWVPFGALILIDECQRIYPMRRDFKKESLDRIDLLGFEPQTLAVEINDDYTGETYTVGRPDNVDDAFDMQRHFQWDIYLSTPHIDKVHDFIREVCQAAYRHKSLSGKLPKSLSKLFGFYNTWYEFKHDPDNAGKAAAHLAGAPIKYRADERLFKCYMSTATGEHTASKADQSILADPKLKAVGLVFVLAIAFLVWARVTGKPSETSPADSVVSGPVSVATEQGKTTVTLDRSKNPGPNIPGAPGDVYHQQNAGFFNQLGYKLVQIAYQDFSDYQHSRLSFLADSEDGLKPVDFRELAYTGVRVMVASLCNVTLLAPDGSQISLGCSAPVVRNCAAFLNSENLIIRRNCHKYGEPKDDQPKDFKLEPALMNIASSEAPSKR